MQKSIHTTNFLVVVISSLLLGCANTLPELPKELTNPPEFTKTPEFTPPEMTQVSTISPLTLGVDPILNSDVFDDEKVDNSGDFPLVFIANDLVKALSFISGMDPELTSTVRTSSGSAFNKLVKESMQQQGYRFADTPYETGSQQLTTSYLETNRELQPRELTAIMAINTVLIKRTYEIQNDSVEPSSLYMIRGINPELVESNEQVRML